jgi:Uma2 family endonuclease
MENLAEPALLNEEIEYPDSDGEPMAESDHQRKKLVYAVEALDIYFADRPEVYVSGNILLYYQKGNPRAAVAPDVLVVIGSDKHLRRSYKLWEEPKAPDFVLEITSESTFYMDQGVKKGLYAQLGVAEYFQYDPTADYLDPPLQGLRLVRQNYAPVPVQTLVDGTRQAESQVLGLALRLTPDRSFHFVDLATGQVLLTHAEEVAARQIEAAARQAAEIRADAAEARVAELEARLHALTGE